MTDHMFPDDVSDEQFMLASAYLDGALDDAEQAAAEADPDVMAAVAALATIQDAVATVEPPHPTARQRAIDAALAEFGGAEQPTVSRPPTSPARSWNRWLGAAAVVAVLGIGAVAVRGLGGGDDNDSADIAATALDQPDNGVAEAADLATTDAPAATEAPSLAAASAPPDVDAATDGAGDEAGDTFEMRLSIPAVTDPDSLLETPEQLAGLGLYLLDQYRAGSLLTPEGSCTYAWATGVADDSVLDVPVLSDGRYLLDGREHAVLIAVDDVTGQAFALDPAGCTVLVVGPVP